MLTLSLCCAFDHRHGHVSANVNGHCWHGYVIVILTVMTCDDHANVNVNGHCWHGFVIVILTVTTCDDHANVNDHLNGNENLCGGCPFVHSCQCEIGQFADGVYVGCVGYENKHVKTSRGHGYVGPLLKMWSALKTFAVLRNQPVQNEECMLPPTSGKAAPRRTQQ